MNKKSFTMIELLISIIIITIIASISVFTYNKAIDYNKQKICIQNQLLINTLLELYTREENPETITLSAIPDIYFEKALAKIIDIDPLFLRKRIVYKKINSFNNKKLCYASELTELIGRKDFLICPEDKTPTNNNGSSYAIVSSLSNWKTAFPSANSAYDAYILCRTNDIPLIVDAESQTFNYTGSLSPTEPRHGGFIQEKYSITTTGKGDVFKCNSAGTKVLQLK